MKRRNFLQTSSIAGTGLYFSPAFSSSTSTSKVKIGMIGLDTSHSVAFTKLINEGGTEGNHSNYQVSHAYPHGSNDIESSVSRIPGYTQKMIELGVKIVPSIKALLEEVDVVLLETNDGRLHLEQAQEVIAAGKPLFIDKPMAASLKDVIQIFELAQKAKVPVFSSSSLRFSPSMQAIKEGKIGEVLGASTYSPAKLEKTHPDLFWYGIHGIESLFTLLGTGCKSVRRIYHPDTDVVIGEWEDGRIGTFRGLRAGKTSYGGTAFGTEGIAEAGIYEGYSHLVEEILKFFSSHKAPVSAAETIEIFAFMEAAELSKNRNGAAVSLEEVMEEER